MSLVLIVDNVHVVITIDLCNSNFISYTKSEDTAHVLSSIITSSSGEEGAFERLKLSVNSSSDNLLLELWFVSLSRIP